MIGLKSLIGVLLASEDGEYTGIMYLLSLNV